MTTEGIPTISAVTGTTISVATACRGCAARNDITQANTISTAATTATTRTVAFDATATALRPIAPAVPAMTTRRIGALPMD